MAIRSDIQDFPFKSRERSVWYFIINWTNRTQQDFCNVQGKNNLVQDLKPILDNQDEINHALFGVWNGQYSTDIFKIPIEYGYNELKKHFGISE